MCKCFHNAGHACCRSIHEGVLSWHRVNALQLRRRQLLLAILPTHDCDTHCSWEAGCQPASPVSVGRLCSAVLIIFIGPVRCIYSSRHGCGAVESCQTHHWDACWLVLAFVCSTCCGRHMHHARDSQWQQSGYRSCREGWGVHDHHLCMLHPYPCMIPLHACM